MQQFIDRTFFGLVDNDSRAEYCDWEFLRCQFESCSLSNASSPPLRSIVRNVRLIDCRQTGCFVRSAILDGVVVDGFKTDGQPLMTWGTVFKHVTLQGRLDRLMIQERVSASHRNLEVQQRFDEANAEFYRTVDWALDISKGEFKDLEIRGVPARLVRRDTETEGVLVRDKVVSSHWRDLHFRSPVTKVCIDLFLDRGEPDYVLAAPKRDPRFRDRLADIRLLRTEGIAEPD